MSTVSYRAALVREIEQAMKRIGAMFGTSFHDGQLDAYTSILQLVKNEALLIASDTDRRPVTYDADFNAAIARGDYTVVANHYLTVWLNGDPEDGYELHLDEGDWHWES